VQGASVGGCVVTASDAAAELSEVLSNDDGWGDGCVVVRRETLAAYLRSVEGES
jgi:hypothetical protein